MKKIVSLLALSLVGCTQIKENIMIDTQNCNAGMFTQCLNTPEYTMRNDTITISSGAKSDFFNAPDGTLSAANAPLLLKEIDNTKPFTFTAKVEPELSTTYDAGAIYLFYNKDLWQKFAFEMDERGVTRLVTVRTINTSDDNNHNSIAEGQVYMKISSDTQTVGFYYSIDGQTWHLARLYRNEYPQKIYLALSSQSPIGKGINSHFTEIALKDSSITDFRLGL